jgi:hypothetical protein
MNQNDWIGSIGVGLILLAYFTNSFGMINNKSSLCLGLNIVLAETRMLSSLVAFLKPLR